MPKNDNNHISAKLPINFLVPKYKRNGKPYPWTVHCEIRQYLEENFDGWSSLGDTPLPGSWRNPNSEMIEYDKSWRYEIGIIPDRLHELDDYLACLANQLGQEAIWRVIYAGGEGRAIPASKTKQQKKKPNG